MKNLSLLHEKKELHNEGLLDAVLVLDLGLVFIFFYFYNSCFVIVISFVIFPHVVLLYCALVGFS